MIGGRNCELMKRRRAIVAHVDDGGIGPMMDSNVNMTDVPAQELPVTEYQPVRQSEDSPPARDKAGKKNKTLVKLMVLIMGILLLVIIATVTAVVLLSESTSGSSEKGNTTVVVPTAVRPSLTSPTKTSNPTPDTNVKATLATGRFDAKASLLVGAFNIRTFGKSKMSKPDAPKRIHTILERYDIVLIQEVKDSRKKVQRELWALLNTTGEWGMVESDRLGRTNQKEQYVFYYKISSAHVTGTFQHPDTSSDTYEREPFSAEFAYSLKNGPEKRIVLLGLHSKPTDALLELQHLPQAIRDTRANFPQSPGVIAMGDFNADCTYLNNRERRSMEIFSQESGFTSLIPDSADTTVANTDCAYDRIVVYDTTGTVVVTDAKVFPFPTELGLTDDEAKGVSDHYPVEFNLH